MDTANLEDPRSLTSAESAPHSGRGLIDALARQLGGHARLGGTPFGGVEVAVAFSRGG